MENNNHNTNTRVCELCDEQLRPMTYAEGGKPVEILYFHNDLTASRCKRIQNKKIKNAKSK
jgi:hypothetical protein